MIPRRTASMARNITFQSWFAVCISKVALACCSKQVSMIMHRPKVKEKIALFSQARERSYS